MRVAILGTGKMGAAMARRLNSVGHEMTLWNRTRKRAEAVGVGTVAATPAEAVAAADVVISVLTDAVAVRDVYLGADGAAKAAKDQVFVEMSTAGPDVANVVAPAIQKTGAQYVEAPVLGSIGAIESGKALVLAAGDEKAIDRARPVLEAFGEIKSVSELGSAASLKLIANSMLAVVTAAAAELQAAGVAAALNPEEVFFLLSRIVPVLGMRRSGLVDHRYEPVTFALRDALKDLNLAREMFGRVGASTPLTSEASEVYEQAARTTGALDMSAVASLYEKKEPIATRES